MSAGQLLVSLVSSVTNHIRTVDRNVDEHYFRVTPFSSVMGVPHEECRDNNVLKY